MTALSKSEIFQIFFKMFFSMIFLGLLHGLCILPVHLSIFHRLTAFTHVDKSGALCDGDDVRDSRLKEGNINQGVEAEIELHDNHVEQSANTIASKTEELNSAHFKGRIIINYRKFKVRSCLCQWSIRSRRKKWRGDRGGVGRERGMKGLRGGREKRVSKKAFQKFEK